MVPLAPIPVEIHARDIVVATLGTAMLPVVMRTRAEQRRKLSLLTRSLILRHLKILVAITLTVLLFQFQLWRFLLPSAGAFPELSPLSSGIGSSASCSGSISMSGSCSCSGSFSLGSVSVIGADSE